MRLPFLFIVIAGLLCAHRSAAQDGSHELNGTIESDFTVFDVSLHVPIESATIASKSVPLAAGLSAIFPGAGQLYAEAPLWRTVLYAGLEVAGWTAYGLTAAKGNELTRDFESYADQHWSVIRYIEWLGANYSKWSDSAVNKPVAADALQRVIRPGDPSRPDWERVDYEQLNRLEKSIRGGFSHTLPTHGQQQYYEQIGKYVQYRAGWDDHSSRVDTVIYDPSRVTDNNREYMEHRADANDYLGYATTALGGIIINHVASLLDAMLEARAFNASIRTEIKGSLIPGSDLPVHASLLLTVRF